MMKSLFSLCIILFISPLFCQIDFYVETDETNYSYGQDIEMTFNLHNTTSDTVVVTFPSSYPFNYYIDGELFIIGSYGVIVYTTILPNSTFSSEPYNHTDNVSIGNHIIVGEFADDWLSDPVIITVGQVNVDYNELIMEKYHLSNYPNPFNPSTAISFQISDFSIQDLEILIFNSKGQKVKAISVTLSGVEGSQNRNQLTSSPSTTLRMTQAGSARSITWDGKNSIGRTCPSGVYLYKLVSNGKELAVNKMMLLK